MERKSGWQLAEQVGNAPPVAEVKKLYELKGIGHGIRDIARELNISRNTVRR